METAKDPCENVTRYEYDKYGNLTLETKPNGAQYEYTYDVLNRLTQVLYKEDAFAAPIVLEGYIYEVLSNGNTKRYK